MLADHIVEHVTLPGWLWFAFVILGIVAFVLIIVGRR